MTLPPVPEGLPPLPKGLRGALALQSGWREADKVHALKRGIEEDLSAGKQEQQSHKSMQGSLTQLRQDMVSLRQLDLSLLCQLLRLYENIQDWKQILSDHHSMDNYDYAIYNGTMRHQSYDIITEDPAIDPQQQKDPNYEEPIYENTPAMRPSFWHTRRKGKTPDRDLSRSPALDNPDFDESMLGPTSTPRRRSKRHNMDSSVIPKHLAKTSTGSHGLGASETFAWLASGSPSKQNGHHCSSSSCSSLNKSGSLNRSSGSHRHDRHRFHYQDYPSEASPNRTSTPVFRESAWSPIRRQGSVSTESEESLYLEPLPCVHVEHQKIWKQDGSPQQDCSGMSGYERQQSANGSYLYESTC